MKKRNIIIISAIAGIALWELQIRPSLPWWVRAFTPLSNQETAIATCKASLNALDWQKIKADPPATLAELETLIGEGCPEALGNAMWESLDYIFKASTQEDGSLKIEWIEKQSGEEVIDG
ncbi:hypothetical protein PMG71_09570 [Roseofilum sp. BLCC_M154]|uniref:Uncharacterized protein n=1 Tax=Roseofilum acuticapitatum BLCC-M154 TaxID=3022444 RepID=A0ABT7ARZ1_9CYAN|nr:hypothetical protein [Roseofilum acuticapitatum]MDJ1169674.1 hypothetical protein [Roseofilum acuticapitatum BLCC-M154]